jgi:hypothetical protein
MNKQPSALILFFSALLFGGGALLATFHTIVHAPEYLGAYFTRVDHPIKPSYPQYNEFLKECVRRDRVDYARARNSKLLDKALTEIATLSCDEFGDPGDKLLYWINAYNLLSTKAVADRFPVRTVSEVANDMASHRYTVGGVPITVKDIRQLKIAPLLQGSTNGDYTDARVLFLICGSAMGYPVICDHALETSRLKHDLEDNTYKFIHRKGNVFMTKKPNAMFISPFFQWNESVLEQSFTNPWTFVIYYLPSDEKPDDSDFGFKENYMTKFDWRINDTETQD